MERRRAVLFAPVLLAALLASGCSRTWEDRPYRHSDAGPFAKESEAYRRSYADLRFRHWRHMVWSRGGTFATPKGFTTESWYELRGCE